MPSALVSLIAYLHIVSHLAICVMDYSQVVPLLDFVTRPDGSPSDPHNLLPLELIYAGITAMSFGTVGFAFVLALLFENSGGVTIQGAAALSVFFHGLWTFHMYWRWDEWRSMMHPAGGLQPEFFFGAHAVWTLLAGVVIILSKDRKKSAKQKTK